MSNHLAVAAVTATLHRVLQLIFDHEAPDLGATVTHVRPNAPSTALPSPGVNLFLYQVTPNVAARNSDTPTRRPDGAVVRRPRVALELNYLLSFHGEESQLEPQVILGVVTRALHGQPVLERAQIEATLADAAFAFVAGADLAEAPDLVRLSPTPMSLEELSKLWSVFFQTPYVLSMAYQASAVIIEAEASIAGTPLPVRSVVAGAQPTSAPSIAKVLSRATPSALALDQPILAGYRLVLVGSQLVGAVRFDGGELLNVESATDTEVVVALPPTLRVGVHSVEVVHQAAFRETPDRQRIVATSNAASFVLRPSVSASVLPGRVVRASLAPPVGLRQRIALLLDPIGAPPATPTFRLEASLRTAEDAVEIDFDVSELRAGAWLVRVDIDGAESPVTSSLPGGAYDTPGLTLP